MRAETQRAHKCVIYAENRNYVASEREWIKTFNHYTDVWAYGATHSNEASEWERRKNNQTHKLDLDGEFIKQTSTGSREHNPEECGESEREKIMF
jgi:hypothetical protein